MISRNGWRWVVGVGGLGLLLSIGGGCSFFSRPDQKAAAMLGRVGGSLGEQAIDAKRCLIKVWMISKPFRDRAVNEAAWERVDESLVETQARREFEENGLKIGILTGGLPAEVEELLRSKTPQKKIEPVVFDLPDTNNSFSIKLVEPVPTVSLFLKRDGQGVGKDYKDASGFFRATASHEGPTGVSLRLVPEIHHGPILRRFNPLPNPAGNYNTHEFTQKDGQQEETLRAMAATLKIEPGQYIVIGHNPDRKGSLGAFLLTHPEENSDRLLQTLVIIEAARSNRGTPGSPPKVPDNLQPVEPPDMSIPSDSASKKESETD